MKTNLLYLFCLITTVAQSQYFQQKVDTEIALTLNDSLHEINAFEKVRYTNNSKDTLTFIYFHLWPNAYKNNTTKLAEQLDESGEFTFHFSPKKNRGYIDSLNFIINDEKLTLEYDDNIDYVKVILNQPLFPKQTLTITTPFRVKIPNGNISRLGHVGQAYQLTQWFPKPAVYDQNGWNVMPYLNQGEFYSEYGSYDVKITLPDNYVVGATGDLVNGETEIAWLTKKAKKTRLLLDQAVAEHKAPKELETLETPESSKTLKTLHYHQENIHDFALFMDKRWNVLKGEVELPFSKRKVTTWAMFTNYEGPLWKDAIAYLDSSIYYYSLWTGEYPYNQVTAVDGALSAGAGMEYPNVTVIGRSGSAFALEQVIIHEVGHNWFYGILGSNERIHAWMDEGMNSYTENRTSETLHPNEGSKILNKKMSKRFDLDQYNLRGTSDLTYLLNARRNYDQPIETPSSLFTPLNYGTTAYAKTAIGFDFLLAYLGDSVFNECMHTYFDEWKFKHPQPKDVETVFERVSKKDLSWFFDDYINTTKKIDYKTTSHNSKTNKLTIVNKGKIASPVSIYGLDKNDSIVFVEWKEGFLDNKSFTVPNGAYRIVLDYKMDSPELDRTNDIIKTKGLFKTSKPLRFKLLGGVENRNFNTINYLPVFGWNETDQAMLGLSFYNSTFPQKKLEWLVMPMYSFRQKKLTGIGQIKYNWYPEKVFRKIDLGYQTKSFSYNNLSTDNNTKWLKSSIKLNFEIYNKKLRTAPVHKFYFDFINIAHFNENATNINSTYANINYQLKSKQLLKPSSLLVNYIIGNDNNDDQVNTISITAKKRWNYNIKLDGVELRLFAGKSLFQHTNSKYNWRMSGQTGTYDYLYNNTFLGRSAGSPNLLSQQLGNSHGGFKTYTNTGSSNNWIVSLNTKLDLPKLPFGLFADLAYYPYKENNQGVIRDKIGSNYDFGLWIPVKKGLLEIYIPLLYSENIQKEMDYNNINFWQRITFKINFNSMNPFKLMSTMNP